jgi:hypothetical protein
VGDVRNSYRILVGKPERKGLLEDPGVDGLNQIGSRGCGVCLISLGFGSLMSCRELGDEPSVSIKSRNFLDLLVEFWALRKDTAALSYQ